MACTMQRPTLLCAYSMGTARSFSMCYLWLLSAPLLERTRWIEAGAWCVGWRRGGASRLPRAYLTRVTALKKAKAQVAQQLAHLRHILAALHFLPPLPEPHLPSRSGGSGPHRPGTEQ